MHRELDSCPHMTFTLLGKHTCSKCHHQPAIWQDSVFWWLNKQPRVLICTSQETQIMCLETDEKGLILNREILETVAFWDKQKFSRQSREEQQEQSKKGWKGKNLFKCQNLLSINIKLTGTHREEARLPDWEEAKLRSWKSAWGVWPLFYWFREPLETSEW